MEPDEIAALKKKQAELAEATGERTSAAEAADTTITINNQAAPKPAPFRPTLPTTRTHSPAPAPTISADTPHYGSETLASEAAPRGTHIETRTTINWGKVAKGALIVGAVVLVAAVVVPAVTSAIMASSAGAPITAAIQAATPALEAAEGFAVSSMQFISNAAVDLWALAGEGFSAAAEATGVTAAVAEVTPTAVAFTKASVVSASTAVAAGGAGAVLLGGVLTNPGSIHIFDTQTVVVPDVATPAGSSFMPTHHSAHTQADASLDPSSTASATLANKSMMASSHAHGLEEAAHAGHHAGEVTHEHARERAHAREALQRSANASRAWADRVGTASEQPDSYASRIAQKSANAIQPRSESYAQQLNQESAALDAALQPAR